VVRCQAIKPLGDASDPTPTDRIARSGNAAGFGLNAIGAHASIERLELAWIVRKKRMWSRS
jgi:hypothetical protein